MTGTRRKRGVLWRREGPGEFHPFELGHQRPPVDELGALFFDANGDARLDLFVVTGGGAFEGEAPELRDRLWLNQGRETFQPAPEPALPDLRDSGSMAAAADFDRDGDLDLFVGSRWVPYRFPLSPVSRLLLNEGGRFLEAPEAQAPGLRHAGLVTGALWSDSNQDGWIDLLVTCEWGPVRYFRNRGGTLIEETKAAGLAGHLGWWTGLSAGDFDEDGDVDYVVTNLGGNSRYQARPKTPWRLYFAEFDGQGEADLLECWVTPSGLLPFRGRGAWLSAMPSLASRIPTYRDFASATLADLVGTPALEAAFAVELNTLESGVLQNSGHGTFAFHPLPRLAQIAPAYGSAVFDADGDGHLDLVLAQNAYNPRRDTGRLAGGLGLVLRGAGDGTFAPVWPDRSGFVAPGDAKSLTLADLDADGRMDLVVGVNDNALLAFLNRAARPERFFTIKLEGRQGNPHAIGSRVTLTLADGARRVAEIGAGNGHLSQSVPEIAFGVGAGGRRSVREVEVRWPEGDVTRVANLDGELGAKVVLRPATPAPPDRTK
jgi:hypothetical protein